MTWCILFRLGGKFKSCLLFRAPSRANHCLTSSNLSCAGVQVSASFIAERKDPLHLICILPPTTQDYSPQWLCQPPFLWDIPVGAGWQGCEEGRRGAEIGRLALPYLTRHVVLPVAAAGCDSEYEDDEPPSKRIEGRRWQRRETHTHCVLPRRENSPQGKSYKEATTLPASASWLQDLAAVPKHLVTCLSVQGGWGRDLRCRDGWVGRRGGLGQRGGAPRLRPSEALRRRSGPTAGRGRQHGGVSGGPGASQQQWRW